MLRTKSLQKTIFDHDFYLPDERIAALKKSWAGPFRGKVLPLIDEGLFRTCYHPDNGRPNVPVITLIAASVLKEMHNLTDLEVLGALEFDLRWHYALDIHRLEAHVCQKTLHNFRWRYGPSYPGFIHHDFSTHDGRTRLEVLFAMMKSGNSLTVIQLNDSHAYFDLHQEMFWQGGQAVYRPAGGYARIATLVKQIRAGNQERVLFCDCGDTLHGTYPVLKTQGQALIPVINSLGLDAMTAHWEFAYGPETFKQRAAKLSYPMLAINVYDQATKERFFPPYSVKEIGGLRIGLVGIASNIIDKTMPPSFSEGLEFTLGRKELPSIINDLRTQEKVDLIVLVSHLGFPQDMELLSEVHGVDICLSGHTHNRLFKPVLQGKTLVIQSGCHGSFLGRLDLEVDGGRVVDYRHQLMVVEAKIAPDPEVDDLVRQAIAPYQDELSTVVGKTATALNRTTTLETTMDNFLLQALLESTGAQLAFSNGWRYGAPIIPGEVTLNDLYNMIPMNPPISTVELLGEEIVAMLEENLERTFARDPYDQMGGYVKRSLGLNASIKIENPPGQRVQQVFVGDEELQPGRYYPTTFVTEQGVAHNYGRNRQQHTERSIEALKAYLAGHRPLRAELRGTFIAV